MRERCGEWRWVLLLFAAATTGCACPGTYYYGGNGCGMRGLSGRNVDASVSCDGDCASCDTCAPETPSRLRDVVGCNSGCGRMYWGEWAVDPPDECDPCDDGGTWTGPRACPPRGIGCLLGFLHGTRYGTTCGSESCDSCEPTSAGGCNCGEGAVTESTPDEIWGDSSEFILESTPETVEPRPASPQGNSVLRESRRAQPNKVPSKQTSSRVVRRGRTPDMH